MLIGVVFAGVKQVVDQCPLDAGTCIAGIRTVIEERLQRVICFGCLDEQGLDPFIHEKASAHLCGIIQKQLCLQIWVQRREPSVRIQLCCQRRIGADIFTMEKEMCIRDSPWPV